MMLSECTLAEILAVLPELYPDGKILSRVILDQDMDVTAAVKYINRVTSKTGRARALADHAAALSLLPPEERDHYLAKQTGKAPTRDTYGTVYFVEMVLPGCEYSIVKIGWTSRDVAERLRDMSTGNPFPLRVLATTPGTRDTERALHNEFQDCKLKNEWHVLTPRLVAKIADLNDARVDGTETAGLRDVKRAARERQQSRDRKRRARMESRRKNDSDAADATAAEMHQKIAALSEPATA